MRRSLIASVAGLGLALISCGDCVPLLRNFQAQSERVTTDQLVERLLETVPLPKSGI